MFVFEFSLARYHHHYSMYMSSLICLYYFMQWKKNRPVFVGNFEGGGISKGASIPYTYFCENNTLV